MTQFLLDNSVWMIFVTTVAVLGFNWARDYMAKKDMDLKDFLVFLRSKLNEVGAHLFTKVLASVAVAFVISLISFRQVWSNDVFHVVFLTTLMYGRVYKFIAKAAQ